MKNRILLIGVLFTIPCFFLMWLNSDNAAVTRTDLKQVINKELVSIDPIDSDSKIDVVYVLGGDPKSFEFKSRAVSYIFKKGICKNIWIANRKGITEYSPELGRNWTKNEYTLLNFNKVGVPNDNIEFVKVKEGFFGTLSEAKDISNLLKERKYKSILLIAQPYHTRRVRICFNKYLSDTNVSIYIQDSGEKMLLRDLIVEYIKLKVYQYFVL